MGDVCLCPITCSQSCRKSRTTAIVPDYLAVSRLCWSCWSGSMCCQWRPPFEWGTALTHSSLFSLGSLTGEDLQRVCSLHRHDFSDALSWVHQRCHVTSCQFAHANTVSCLELTQPLDQETPRPPGEARETAQTQSSTIIDTGLDYTLKKNKVSTMWYFAYRYISKLE